jgi:hypothetical protein
LGTFNPTRCAPDCPNYILTWSNVPPGTLSSSDPLTGIIFGESQFVAFALNGSIFTSTNGVPWIRRDRHTRQDIWGAAYGNGTFVAVGNAGTIVQTVGPLPRFRAEQTRLSDDDVIRMMIETRTGVDLLFERSSDLNSWMSVGMLTNSPGLVELADPISETLGKHFYRVKQLSP